jgi:hypothetical protein
LTNTNGSISIYAEESRSMDFRTGYTTSFWGKKSHVSRHVDDVRKKGSDQALFMTEDKNLILVTHEKHLCAPQK